MSIQGVQLIYRLSTTIRLFIDKRTGVDSYNFYWSNVVGGPYTLFRNIINSASRTPATRGKVVFEFNTSSLVGWSNDVQNYIKMAPVTGVVVGAQEGPLLIPTRISRIIPKEYAVIYGLNTDSQKFIPVSVDETGKVETI
jgi:hypothetical protein